MNASLLSPRCALAWGHVVPAPCPRCFSDKCQDRAAFHAQLRAGAGAAPKPPEPLHPFPLHQDAPTPSTPPTGAVASLPWRSLNTPYVPDGATPWTLLAADDTNFALVSSGKTAAFIVLAANHHAALVAALEEQISEWAWMDEELLNYNRDISGKTNRAKYTRILAVRGLLARVLDGVS